MVDLFGDNGRDWNSFVGSRSVGIDGNVLWNGHRDLRCRVDAPVEAVDSSTKEENVKLTAEQFQDLRMRLLRERSRVGAHRFDVADAMPVIVSFLDTIEVKSDETHQTQAT